MTFIREHAELIRRTVKQKGLRLSVDQLLLQDRSRRDLLQQVEVLRSERNQLTSAIAKIMQQGQQGDVLPLRNQVKDINQKLHTLELQLKDAEQHYNELMLHVPNPVSEDTPIGKDDQDNVEIRRWGEVPQFSFDMKDHVALGELHDLFDLPRGVKTAGSRNYYLKGNGLLLHLALQRLALDYLMTQGFTPMDVPVLVRPETLKRTGFFPGGEDQVFRIEGESKCLTGTSEVSLISYYSDEIVDLELPIRLAGLSACYRNEIGSAGRDVRGLYRVHQFAKVEQVVLCQNDPEQSEAMLQEMTRHAEHLLQLLELPYRVVAVCTGDMSAKTHKQYDIETWMPSRQTYSETHSSSNLLDYQARRSNIRYRDEHGQLHYCHTMNNTAVASPRILIPLLENHQQEDGSVYIPKALRPYMNGMEKLI